MSLNYESMTREKELFNSLFIYLGINSTNSLLELHKREKKNHFNETLTACLFS